MVFQDLVMEQACVLFNVAVTLGQIAVLQDRSIEGLKLSASYFQVCFYFFLRAKFSQNLTCFGFHRKRQGSMLIFEMSWR